MNSIFGSNNQKFLLVPHYVFNASLSVNFKSLFFCKALKSQDSRCDNIEKTLSEINEKMHDFSEVMKKTQTRVETIAEK